VDFFSSMNPSGNPLTYSTTSKRRRCSPSYRERRVGGLLLLGIDGTAYALSYGTGYLLIPDELKDERFGLGFLIRRLDSGQVQELVRRRANARGRTDTTTVAAGAPAWMLGVAENVEITGGSAGALSALRGPHRSATCSRRASTRRRA
jgi:uncharacterized protein (TIGR04141 family)